METEHMSTEGKLGQYRKKNELDVLGFNENEYTIYPNLWDIMKVVYIEKFTELRCYIKMWRDCILATKHLKVHEQNVNTTKRSIF